MLPLRLPYEELIQKWKSEIDPIISSPLLDGQLLSGIKLVTGVNTINHGLQRKLQGWIIVGISAPITVYDNQASNQTPNLTLSLTASGAATVALWVF